MNRRTTLVTSWIAPILASWVPLAYLLAENADQTSAVAAVAPAIWLLGANLIAVPLFRVITQSWPGAAVAATFGWTVFFFNGPVFDRVWDQRDLETVPTINRLLLVCSIAITLLGAWFVRTRHARFGGWPRWIMLPAAISIGFSASRVLISSNTTGSSSTVELRPVTAARASPPSSASPDIYHIILDGYSREDVLHDVYEYDNVPFIEALEKRGFRILKDTFSNYSTTFLSLSATLNGRYHSKDESAQRQRNYHRLIQESWAASTLKSMGYRHHWVGTSWGGTESSPLADVTHALRSPLFRDEFSSVFWRGTALRPLEPTVARSHLFAFASLEAIAELPESTYTFAHVLAPHNPYVFDADGTIVANVPQTLQFNRRVFTKDKRWGDRDGYVQQLRFINKRVLQTIDKLLDQPGPRPVIVLQSDHGSAHLVGRVKDETALAKERNGVLNAILAPPEVVADWPQPCTLVNTYPILLSRLFGLDLDTLPDRIYYSWYNLPYSFRDVTDALLHREVLSPTGTEAANDATE